MLHLYKLGKHQWNKDLPTTEYKNSIPVEVFE